MPGYRQTEIGVLPEEWAVEPLRRCGSIKTGPFGTLLKAREYSSGEGVPLISVGEIGDGMLQVDAETPLVPPAVVKRLPEYVLCADDIVLGRKGAVDRSALVAKNQDGWFLGSDGIRIRITKGYAPFLAWQFQRTEIKSWLLANSSGTTMPSMNQEILSRLRLPCPPVVEQCAVAEVLSDVNELMIGLADLIVKKRDLKQAAMQQLLTGQTRLPGFSGEWTSATIGDVAEIVSGGTPRTTVPSYWNGGIQWCTPTDITGTTGKYLRGTERTISLDGLKSSSATLLPPGALLLCSRATIGEVKISLAEACTNQGFKSLVVRDGVSNEFLYYLLLTLKARMVERAVGSTFLEISKRDVAALTIAVPSSDEQSAIAAVLCDMDEELDALERRLSKTRDLKQAMMQELLTGRTRLV